MVPLLTRPLDGEDEDGEEEVGALKEEQMSESEQLAKEEASSQLIVNVLTGVEVGVHVEKAQYVDSQTNVEDERLEMDQHHEVDEMAVGEHVYSEV